MGVCGCKRRPQNPAKNNPAKDLVPQLDDHNISVDSEPQNQDDLNIPMGSEPQKQDDLNIPVDSEPQYQVAERIDALSGARVEPTVIVISHTVVVKQSAAQRIMQHFVIEKTGEIVCIAPVAQGTWHAGIAFWSRIGPCGVIADVSGVNDVNSHSIGIALVGNGCERRYKDAQYESLLLLIAELRGQFNINEFDIVGLGEVAHPPKRHAGPGALFDWDRLESCGSTFPSRKRIASLEVGNDEPEESDALRREVSGMLVDLGYSIHGDPHGIERRVETVLDRYIGERISKVDFSTAWRVLEQIARFRRANNAFNGVAQKSAELVLN